MVLDSAAAVDSPAYRENYRRMLELVDGVKTLEDRVRRNSERSRERFEERGQLLPRDRLLRLLDRGSSFIELSPLAGCGMHDDDGAENIAGGNVITGIGEVCATRCLVMVSDSGIKGGALTPMGAHKIMRAQEIALQNRLPVVNLLESAGGNLNYQGEIFVPGGGLFYNEARLSAAGIPQVTVVHGSSTAGGAYLPGLTDYIVMVRGRAKVFLAGPPLLKAATGEIATDEELGGADMHASRSGTAEYLADDDAGAIETARLIIDHLDWNAGIETRFPVDYAEPLYASDELLGIVPVDYRKPYDCRAVIARLADGSAFLEFKPNFGPELVCGHSRIGGIAAGIIGNNGPIFPAGSQKAAHFIQACCQAGQPIIYLQNTTGYMVGRETEQNGAVKHGSKMIQAVSNASVPQITLMIGASFGAGNYGMCGRAFGPRFVFAWPNSRVAIMGAKQAAKVMDIIARAAAKRKQRAVDETQLKQREAATIARIEEESRALHITARLWDDGIIDPRDSRRLLIRLLRLCLSGDCIVPRANSFGVARP